MRLAIVTTHPIQYYAPLFKLLHQTTEIEINVYYSDGDVNVVKFDHGFQKNIQWDIPLLDGYPFEFISTTGSCLQNISRIVNPRLISRVKKWNPEAILIYGWAKNSHLQLIRYFKGKLPIYFRGDSHLIDKKRFLTRALRFCLLTWIYNHVDYAFYAGSLNKRYFLKYGLRNSQLIWLPHAVDNDRFGISRAQDVADLKNKLGITANALVIVYAGKFETKKNPIALLEAFIQMNVPQVHLLFVGNGKLESEIKKNALGKENIHVLDFVNQSYMPVIYQTCDIFCLPSIGPAETWGLAVNEAMACGKAVLISNKVGCAIDLVRPGINGQIFDPNSSDDLLKQLNELISKGKNALKTMGDESKKIIISWSVETQLKSLLIALKKL